MIISDLVPTGQVISDLDQDSDPTCQILKGIKFWIQADMDPAPDLQLC